MLSSNDIKKRWLHCWEAKRDELDRIEKAYLWMYEFERHLRKGEEGRAAYRFPETMGYVMRRYNNLLEVLPEARVRGDGDGVVGLQGAIDHYKRVSNIDRVKQLILADAAFSGTGCMQVIPTMWTAKNKKKKEYVKYDGLSAERCDWRHFFPAPGFTNIHDHTGRQSMPYNFRRKIYHVDTFFNKYKKMKDVKNLDKVEPSFWNDANIWGDEDWATSHEIQETSSAKEFVAVLELWDQEGDYLEMYANGGAHIYSSKEGIPYDHKSLPFHIYRNVPRLDSINGLGEVEINLPYNLYRERMLNLGIMDSELQVQPAQVIAGDVNFNTEENELEPGAQFTLRGTGFSGDIRKHIMPYQAGGGLSGAVFQMIQLIENSRISVTSDDTTALYSNPNQLATQTLAKMQTLNKSVDATTKRNIYDSEFYLVNQIASYVTNEFSEPYKLGKETINRKIKINGYDVVQENKDAEVKFVKGHGAEGEYYLNEKTGELFDEQEIEVVPAKQDEELKRDRTEKLMLMTQTIFQTVANLAGSNPQLIQQIFGDMDFPAYLKFMAKNLGVEKEIKDIFPVVAKESYELDAIDEEHKQIMAGITPPIRPDEDSLEEIEAHMRFKNSAFFKKNAKKKQKDALNKHINLTAINAEQQNAQPVAERQEGAQGAPGGIGQPGIQGWNQVVGGTPQGGGAQGGIPTPPTQNQPSPLGGAAQALQGVRR